MIITSIPRLENIAAAKIAVEVCNKPDVKFLNKNLEEKLAYIFSLQSNNKQWKELQTNISQKISSLGLPKLLQKKVNGLIRPVLLEIEQWKEDHCEILCTHIDLQMQISWNPDGTINREKTAEALIQMENFDIRNRFVLACFYFLEDDILTLWHKLSCCYEQTSIYDTNASPIVRFWVNWLKGHEMDWACLASECVLYPPPNLFPINALVFSRFLHLLPASDKMHCLIFQINRRRMNRSDLFSCLSKLNRNERTKIFKECAKNILRHYINWPLQNHFLEMAECLWPYLSETNFQHLLEFILHRRILQEWSDFDYIGLLKDFWLSSPDHFKEFVKGKNVYKSLMVVINHDRTKPLPKERLRRKFLLCPLFLFNALGLSGTRGTI
ncbi:hypothetical protein AVEN_46861-1 [Araneus ventricosus]|uniref:Uncharacterized protein n=1 Tax=Araneus ventricosus TaxID=182803 RepID=A0A4Y2CMB8_ARAVE|nr:hypothetical protein AVEN_46861-1 [Araneus ventricosus]